MSLSEIEILLFLPLVLLAYWAVPRRDAQNAVLLAASWAFYASWDWRLLGIVLAGTAIDWLVLGGLRPESGLSPARRTRLVWTSLGFALGALAFFKYENFFAEGANALLGRLGLGASVPVLDLLLPLGISFYTLQRVGYVLDVHWGRAEAPRSLLAFANFCCYFPQLAAGPIARGGELMRQLEAPRRLREVRLADAAGAILLGFALKSWAADAIGAAWVDPVFAAPSRWGVAAHWLALVGFTLQVFGDFAGYSLMAIGVSGLLGIELPQNFDRPLLSRSLPELWRRWHVTLNRWLFDYVFTPLTTRDGWFRGRIAAALVVTFLVSGLWHGAAWTYVLWGLLHGLGMVAHTIWDERYRGWCRRDRRWVAVRKSTGYAVAAWLLTMAFFVATMIPFRAASLPEAATFAAGLFAGAGRGPDLGGLVGLAAAMGAVFIVAHHLVALPPMRRAADAFLAAPAVVRGAAYGAAVLFLVIFAPVGSGSFIYQQY